MEINLVIGLTIPKDRLTIHLIAVELDEDSKGLLIKTFLNFISY